MTDQPDSLKRGGVLVAGEIEKQSPLLRHYLAPRAWSLFSVLPLSVPRLRSPASTAVGPDAVDLTPQRLYQPPLGWQSAVARCSRAGVTRVLAEFQLCFLLLFLHLDIHPCTARADPPTSSPPHSAGPAAAVGVRFRHLMAVNLRLPCVTQSPAQR